MCIKRTRCSVSRELISLPRIAETLSPAELPEEIGISGVPARPVKFDLTVLLRKIYKSLPLIHMKKMIWENMATKSYEDQVINMHHQKKFEMGTPKNLIPGRIIAR